MTDLAEHVTLVCPETKLPLVESSREEAEAVVSGGRPLHPRLNTSPKPVGPTERVMVRADRTCAYPILDGIPILLGPEILTPAEHAREIDLSDPRYDEAYKEMEFYNAVALEQARTVGSSRAATYLEPARSLGDEARDSFPEPRSIWLNATHDSASEWDAFQHIKPLAGKRVMQLGGSGLAAVKFLLAGCAEAWLITPMIGELIFATRLAEHMNVADRLRCAAGVGEAIPVADNTFDAVYSGGCLHHMRTEQAFPEIARVLAPGGKFSAVDPWRAPLYALGTKALGKREEKLFGKRAVGVYCRPLTAERVAPAFRAFETADVVQHGALTRYPLLALWKLGLKIPTRIIWQIGAVDDRICSYVPKLRTMGSSVAVLGTRGPATTMKP